MYVTLNNLGFTSGFLFFIIYTSLRIGKIHILPGLYLQFVTKHFAHLSTDERRLLYETYEVTQKYFPDKLNGSNFKCVVLYSPG